MKQSGTFYVYVIHARYKLPFTPAQARFGINLHGDVLRVGWRLNQMS